MTPAEETHARLTALRGAAFEELFGVKPTTVYPADDLRTGDDDPFLIDVFVYEFEVDGNEYVIHAAVTNGMSDHAMPAGDDPDTPRRRELVQYLYDCTPDHAKRLRDMAWLPLHDGFLLDGYDTVAWEWPAVEGTPWKSGFFLPPMLRSHREFGTDVDGDELSLLWHIPISDDEREYAVANGSEALVELMQEVELPWVFDEDDRPPLNCSRPL